MNRKIKYIVIMIITFIIGIIGYSQVIPIKTSKPSKDFHPIEISNAKNTIDNEMTLSFLYNLTQNIHPVGSNENYVVKDYITRCLDEMNLEYKVETRDLDFSFFEDINKIYEKKLLKIKEDYYNNLKATTKDEDVDKYIREQTQYTSFDEFYEEEIATTNGINVFQKLEENAKNKSEEYKNKKLSNIIVKLKSTNAMDAQNIMFVAHYDSATDSFGAGDNGMCVAGLLETIRNLKDKKFNNNIYIMFTDGEEENFWGANEFIKNNNIPIDLVVNFDNAGNSGNLILYHYSNNSLVKQYFKAVTNESVYSFINELLYNPNSIYYQGETSDAFSFIDSDYNTIDFALVGNPFSYHTKEDSFYNIDSKALENITKTMFQMMNFYGENDITSEENCEMFFFKILDGVEISTTKITYNIISIVCIVFSCIYIVILFIKKKNNVMKMIFIVLTICSVLSWIVLKNLCLLFAIPCIIFLISEIIKNNRIKKLVKIILLEGYFFVFIQLLVPLIQYTIWLFQSWYA